MIRFLTCQDLYLNSEEVNDDTNYEKVIYVEVECDTEEDLPNQTKQNTDETKKITLAMGSKAHVISTNKDYKLKSNGTWVEQQGTDITSLVNQISQLSGEVTMIYDSVAVNHGKIIELENLAVDLIDSGSKNMLNMVIPTTSQITITDNGDGTFTASGTVTSVQSVLLGRIYNHGGESLFLNGCPDGGSGANGYSLLIANEAGSLVDYDEGDGLYFTRPQNESYFRVYARFRPGTYTSLTFKPMVCYASFAEYTTKFVPYSPTNAELYKLIQTYHP